MKPLLLILFIIIFELINNTEFNGFGYWLFGANMKNVNL